MPTAEPALPSLLVLHTRRALYGLNVLGVAVFADDNGTATSDPTLNATATTADRLLPNTVFLSQNQKIHGA